ncbi:hypothetical protein BJ322DRAFT_445168 [Thelephora terrestris]|uniref:F-box domain-containing protein n=1 Tax=Thelephora terrestris TaxID=56493 RepID=A0A9P6H481_9AGAM|nr:hypothetical protein BJ322DRAFT_662607 [Thelephora terrestris]KAF9779183.1 hypothetical protein BJ322DRAFT_445168 [Thelephora terrestris]
MGNETDIDSTIASEQKTAEQGTEIIQPKYIQHDPSTIACIPPEILGYIFQLAVEPQIPQDGDIRFAGIKKGSYKFLLVCLYWYQVANRTPELWSSWGTSLQVWTRRYLHHKNSPLDLVLDGNQAQFRRFDEMLSNALKSRAAEDLIRKVHIRVPYKPSFATSVLSSLTPTNERIRDSSIESIALANVGVPDSFFRSRFPKLRDLSLSWCWGFDFDHLKSHTTTLITLSLREETTPPISTAQILSLLASNPNLQDVTLWFPKVNFDSTTKSQVPLRHLKRFSLRTTPRASFALLHQLEFPVEMDRLELTWTRCTVEEIREVIGPYIRGRLRGHGGSEAGLSVHVNAIKKSILLSVGVAGSGVELSPPCAKFEATLLQRISSEEKAGLRSEFLAFTPKERITCFGTKLPANEAEEFVTMPNIEVLGLCEAAISDSFLLPDPAGPPPHRILLPSLRELYLRYTVPVANYNWDPLVRFLIHRTRVGHPLSRVYVFGQGARVCSEVQKQIRDLVEQFDYFAGSHVEYPFFSFNRCSD